MPKPRTIVGTMVTRPTIPVLELRQSMLFIWDAGRLRKRRAARARHSITFYVFGRLENHPWMTVKPVCISTPH